jgi:hypothetical protein
MQNPLLLVGQVGVSSHVSDRAGMRLPILFSCDLPLLRVGSTSIIGKAVKTRKIPTCSVSPCNLVVTRCQVGSRLRVSLTRFVKCNRATHPKRMDMSELLADKVIICVRVSCFM